MSRESIATISALFLPLALTALAALAAWGTRAIARLIKDRRVALALEVLATGVAGVAADLAQHVVADLKDPSKPGTWSSVSAASVRTAAIERAKQLYPQAVALAREALADPSKVDELLGTMLERAVVDLKAKTPARAVAIAAESISVRGAEVALDRPTVAPPEAIAPAGAFDPTAHITRDELPPLGR